MNYPKDPKQSSEQVEKAAVVKLFNQECLSSSEQQPLAARSFGVFSHFLPTKCFRSERERCLRVRFFSSWQFW
jgi:hypothetical protein